MPDIPPDRIAYAYSEAETWALQKIADARQNRSVSWDTFWGVLALLEFGVGFVVLGAYYAGWVAAAAFRTVLATAYVAFTAGIVAYGIAFMLWRRQYARAAYHAGGYGGKNWELSFDDAGLKFACEASDTRVPWSAVDGIEQHNAMVVIWFDRFQPLGVPARAFGNDTARDGFVAAIGERIAAARR